MDFRKNLTSLYYTNRGCVSIIKCGQILAEVNTKRNGLYIVSTVKSATFLIFLYMAHGLFASDITLSGRTGIFVGVSLSKS